MPRRYKPIKLPLRPVPLELEEEVAVCPNCREMRVPAIGRMGLRLVFRCEACRVNFHRVATGTGLY